MHLWKQNTILPFTNREILFLNWNCVRGNVLLKWMYLKYAVLHTLCGTESVNRRAISRFIVQAVQLYRYTNIRVAAS